MTTGMTSEMSTEEHDVLVIGSGAGGLSTAVTARKHGLDVLVIEKEPFFGGTTAFSGGVLWVPGNRHAAEKGLADSREAARLYLARETGNAFQPDTVDAFLEYGPRMLDFFERETEVKFVSVDRFPDYHQRTEGSVPGGRSVVAAPYDARRLGPELKRLRPPLESITFVGMMFNSANDELKHFFNVTRSLASAAYVVKRVSRHLVDLATHGRGVALTSGNALAARLARSAFDLGIEIRTGTPALRLLREEGRVVGAVVRQDGAERAIRARKGVVLACGGFPRDAARLSESFPHVRGRSVHVSPAPEGNTGDGLALAQAAGGTMGPPLPNAGAWIPVSQVPRGGGRTIVFPHLVDRAKPGVIAVNQDGRRFTNESASYHDVGGAIQKDCEGRAETYAWLVCDHRTIRRYGLGHAKPAPLPLGGHLSSGYLAKGGTVRELAQAIGVDPAALEDTLSRYNGPAERGEDPEFGKGSTAFDRYLGDQDHKPNPCVAPVKDGPFYAVKVYVGDLGTFEGLRTDPLGHVLDERDLPVEGLYAVGNDRMSMMGGNYPGAGITLGPGMTFGYVTGLHLAGRL